MRCSSCKSAGVALSVFGAIAAFGVLAAQTVSAGSGSTNEPIPAARATTTVTAPVTVNQSVAVDLNNWQETARSGSPRRTD